VLLTASIIVVLSAAVDSSNHVEWKYLCCAVIAAFVLMAISWLALHQANTFKLGWVRGCCSALLMCTVVSAPHAASMLLFPFPQSAALSGLAITVELMGLAFLLRSEDPTFRTVVSGTLVRFMSSLLCRPRFLECTLPPPPRTLTRRPLNQVMQAVLGATCVLFGALWLRAVARVRHGVLLRTAMAHRLAKVTGDLDGPTRSRVVHAVVSLQASVRRWQRAVRVARMSAMDAYEASTPYRTTMLWLLHTLVALYLLSCTYVILLYGR
jgi:hypothetical protein